MAFEMFDADAGALASQGELFTVCIKNTIREYGGPSVVCDQYLANADDAGATKFIIALDKSTYPTDRLAGVGMRPLQGAALLLGNDAEFTEQDFYNIIHNVGTSSKFNNSAAIGKHGYGLLLGYSVTDVIQLASCDQVVFIDPQQAYVPRSSGQEHTSVSCSLTASDSDADPTNLLAQGPDILQPLTNFTADCQLLPPLAAKAPFPGTLFRLALRTDGQPSSRIDSVPFTVEHAYQLLQSSIASCSERLIFTRHIQHISVMLKETQSSKAQVLHSCRRQAQNTALPAPRLYSYAVSIYTDHGSGSLSSQHWMVAVHQTPAGSTAAVAVLLSDNRRAVLTLPGIEGKVFSTLPTMLQSTGLGMHVNAKFKMAADKRQLYAGPGHRGQGEENIRILEEDVAPAMAVAIEELCIKYSGCEPERLYRLWPNPESIKPRALGSLTAPMVSSLILRQSSVLWVPHHDGIGGQWAAVHEVCLLPEAHPPSSSIICVARRAGLLIPDAPEHILKAVRHAAAAADMTLLSCNPCQFRQALLSAGNIVKVAEMEEVLSYAASDECYEELHGLHLVLTRTGAVQQVQWQGPLRAITMYYVIPPSMDAAANLMFAKRAQLVVQSETWQRLAGMKSNGTLLLSDVMNVTTVSVENIASCLHPVRQGRLDDAARHWDKHNGDYDDDAMLHRLWQTAPAIGPNWSAAFSKHMIVSVHGPAASRLACMEQCWLRAALTPAHLHALPPQAADILTALGCLCILDPNAACASPSTPSQEPVSTALAAVAQAEGKPLHQLVAPCSMSEVAFAELRNVLASLPMTEAQKPEVWAVLRECNIFENAAGAMTHLSTPAPILILPHEQWEHHLHQVASLLAVTILPYHLVEVQQKLLRSSPFQPIGLSDFLNHSILPAIDISPDSSILPLVGQALDDLNGLPDLPLGQALTHIPIEKRRCPISHLVDGNSPAFKLLFGSTFSVVGPLPRPPTAIFLLPESIFTSPRVQVLQRSGAVTEHTARPDFLQECTCRFAPLASMMTQEERMAASSCLVKILRHIADSSLSTPLAGPNQIRLAAQLADSCVFVPAQLPEPYNTASWPPLVSINTSADHACWKMAANGIAMTSQATGNTIPLREKLGRQQICVDRVADHLTATARDPEFTVQLQLGKTHRQFLQESLHYAVLDILKLVQSQFAELDPAVALPEGLATTTTILRGSAWLPAQDDTQFILASQLCFNTEAVLNTLFPVPDWLGRMLEDRPFAKKWLIQHLEAKDYGHGIPEISKSLHPTEEADKDYFTMQDDSAERDCDFKLQVGRGTICLLNCVFTALDPQHQHEFGTLPDKWVPEWEEHWLIHGQPAVLEVTCDITGRTVSFEAAHIFFSSFYSGTVDWPEENTAHNMAQEVLVLASFFQVPHLTNAAELALRRMVDASNCCLLLAMADKYGAAQLRAYCVYYAGRARNINDLHTLSAELQAEVHQASNQ